MAASFQLAVLHPGKLKTCRHKYGKFSTCHVCQLWQVENLPPQIQEKTTAKEPGVVRVLGPFAVVDNAAATVPLPRVARAFAFIAKNPSGPSLLS